MANFLNLKEPGSISGGFDWGRSGCNGLGAGRHVGAAHDEQVAAAGS